MRKSKIKKFIKNEKGSALILTMIVLVNAILIVTAIGVVSIMEQKSSSRTKNSTPALQMADSGMEYILKEINVDGCSTVDKCCDSFNSSTGRCAVSISNVTIYFIQEAGGDRSVVTNGSAELSNVAAVRSVGVYGTGQERVTRALEADIN
jgi:Tfp pilus assembly protein PilX